MSGRHPELIEAGIANLPEGRRRDCLRKVLEFLLDNQYVKSGALPERLWKVEEGSGMGLAHSGDLCDAALDSLAESWTTDPVVLREHGVRLYVRFRDDIFFIGSDRRLSVQWQQLYSMAFGVSCPRVRLSWYNALRKQAFVIKQLGRRQG